MNILRKIYFRIYQSAFHIMIPFLPYREPKILDKVEDIASILKEKNINSVLFVTDENLRKFNVTSTLENSLKTNDIKCAIYDKTCPNPTVINVNEAKEMYLKNNCSAIVAMGGGSSMDTAKAVGALIAYPKKTLNDLKGTLKVLRKIPLLICVPTTSGTGSEVTLAAVITNSEEKYKYPMNDFTLIPRYAVLDPRVTYSLPKSLTATTGMDALTHAVEAYIGRSTTKETRKKAEEACILIYQNIIKAYNEPTSFEARKNMLKASYSAGIAFSKSYVGYIHAIAHSLGGQYNVPHGLANAVIMPIVLKEYGKSAYKKLWKLGLVTKVCSKTDSYRVGAEKFIDSILKLNKEMNIPTYIEGIKEEDIDIMVAHAEKEANPLYPVPKLMNKEELKKIYYLIMKKEGD